MDTCIDSMLCPQSQDHRVRGQNSKHMKLILDILYVYAPMGSAACSDTNQCKAIYDAACALVLHCCFINDKLLKIALHHIDVLIVLYIHHILPQISIINGVVCKRHYHIYSLLGGFHHAASII